MLVTDENVKAAIAIVTPVLLDWMKRCDYPYGDYLFVEATPDETNIAYVACIILNQSISKASIVNLIEDGRWNGELYDLESDNSIILARAATPAQAVFKVEMDYRKHVLSAIHEVINEPLVSLETLKGRYIPFSKLTETQFTQFVMSVKTLMRHGKEDWYEYSDSLQTRVASLEELLNEAAKLFRVYEESHRNKIPVSNDVSYLCAKADRNADIASRIETALGIKHEIQHG